MEPEFDTEWTDLPVCPKCGSLDHDWWDGMTTQVVDGSVWRAECGECGEEYRVAASLDVTFTTSVPEG